ncbi:MAG TPA: hypothetical protein VJ924_09335 [Alphaproteobacteria bacterium]|nr:hypothetical protein [Alphaproteobacteria bacterium]
MNPTQSLQATNVIAKSRRSHGAFGGASIDKTAESSGDVPRARFGDRFDSLRGDARQLPDSTLGNNNGSNFSQRSACT